MSGHIIGVDIGTSGSRAVLCDEQGSILGVATSSHRTVFSRPGWAEQDPMDVYHSVVKVIAEVVRLSNVRPRDVATIALSSVFHSLILLDAHGTPLTNCIVWLDTRSTPDAEEMFESARHLYLNTGCPANSSYPSSKLAWFRRTMPGLFSKIARVASIKDFVVHKLTGEYVVDECVAGGSGLLNVHKLQWDDAILDHLDVQHAWLSPIVPVTTTLALCNDVRTELGLATTTKLVVGAGDGMLASVGSGASLEGALAIMMGTSGACRIMTAEPKLDNPNYQRTWSYPFGGGIWATGTSVNNCGSAHEWIIDTLFSEEKTVGRYMPGGIYDILRTYMSSTEPGAQGLTFLPWLLSERGPYWHSDATGAFIGLKRQHSKPDMYRAVVEGIIYLVATLVDIVEEVAGPAREVRATGGLTNSEAWVTILASIMGRDVLLPEAREAVAFGACLLAMVAMHALPDIAATRRLSRVSKICKPSTSSTEAYRQGKEAFMCYYKQLKPLYTKGSH